MLSLNTCFYVSRKDTAGLRRRNNNGDLKATDLLIVCVDHRVTHGSNLFTHRGSTSLLITINMHTEHPPKKEQPLLSW